MNGSASRGIAVRGLTKTFGDRALFDRIDFDVADREFMVIVGPSGCGKSTLLRAIAGLESVTSGRVEIGGNDVSSDHPGDRDVAMVFQDYALYPHMSVAHNLDFGLRARRLPRHEIRARVAKTAAILGLEDKLGRKPGQLSGGERQRVALGRAMIREPRAYLMDEPLSNLDAALRVQLRAELLDFHRRTQATILYVTHDQTEAMTMGQRIAVMKEGRFEQVGTPDEVYERPANTFVATFLGSPRMNVLEGRYTATGRDAQLEADGLSWPIPKLWPDSANVLIGFRPESVTVGTESATQSAFSREVDLVEHLGNEVIVHLAPRGADGVRILGRLSPKDLRRAQSSKCFGVESDALHIFDMDGKALAHLATHINETYR